MPIAGRGFFFAHLGGNARNAPIFAMNGENDNLPVRSLKARNSAFSAELTQCHDVKADCRAISAFLFYFCVSERHNEMGKINEFISRAWAWIGGDGLQHFAISAIVVFMFGGFCPLWVAVLIALFIGFAKEAYDLGKSDWSVSEYDWKHSLHDVICDAAGCIFGLIVCLLWLLIK